MLTSIMLSIGVMNILYCIQTLAVGIKNNLTKTYRKLK